MLHFVWKLWDKSATGVIKVEAIQLVWGPVIYPLFPCQLSSSSLSVVIFIDRRREPRQKKSLQRRVRGPGLFYLCLNPIQVRYFSFSWVLIELSLSFTDWCSNNIHLLLRLGLSDSCYMFVSTHISCWCFSGINVCGGNSFKPQLFHSLAKAHSCLVITWFLAWYT